MDSTRGGVLGAGGVLSFLTKDIWETTSVRGVTNSIVINLQVNAPLYEGTRIVIQGLTR